MNKLIQHDIYCKKYIQNMKQTIRLTESGLHSIVRKAVNKIIREAQGYANNYGNGMVGGSWGSRTLYATYDLYNYIDDALYDAGAFESKDGGKIDEFIRSCGSKGIFNIEVDVVESYDNSVGVDYDAKIENIDYNAIDKIKNVLKNLPTKNLKFKNAALNGLKAGIDRLETDDSVIEYLDIDYGE